ncbi:MAG: RloB domain-containing protein [Bacteroidetes bacterium]|nr:RloB domain-containing protein [Bacteroidota bacterium]
MIEPWNIKQDDTRISDSLPTFIIFCEDEVSEPIYFKYFETSKIKVNPIDKQKSKIENVLKAICYCEKNGLMELKNGVLCLQSENTQIWCVYDRDIEEIESELLLGNNKFDESVETAKAKGFKVAWSNDAFELWVLLHFEDIDLANENNKNRKTYYDRLTDIFKSLSDPNEDLKNALKHESFNYKKDLKHENNFRNIVRKEIIGKTKDAIKRAKKLEEHYSAITIPNHDKSPCTLVHHLVEELIRLGGKKI